ncbi:MAG: hypothetical protein DI566_12795 [Microbacterium sp.]|nr:MAG: hypothetical protein DI566_12795 [Microbacterium sp.]
MTETRRRRDIRLDQAKENAEAGYATRRQLIGLGAAGAAAVGGTALLVGTLMPKPETPATADAPATTRTPSPSATPKTTPSSVPTSSAPPTTPPDTITPAPDRPNAQKPYAGGGPRTRDESFTQAEPGTSVPPGRQTTAYSRAAAAATPVQQSVFASADAKSHLLRRATFGARPADVAELDRLGIDGWIEQQLHPETIPDAAADSLAAQLPYGDASPARIWQGVASDAFDEYSWTPMYQTAQLAMGRQLFSKRQLLEVLVDVFSDQVHVPLPSDQWHTSPDYIAQVVRPHALGKFRDMLIAAMRHPAMLYYLSNDQSRGNRVNENLGRELLELHSVGISGGYTEADVLASARILSGRAVEYRSGTFSYHPEWHYVGPVSVLGFSHPNSTAAAASRWGMPTSPISPNILRRRGRSRADSPSASSATGRARTSSNASPRCTSRRAPTSAPSSVRSSSAPISGAPWGCACAGRSKTSSAPDASSMSLRVPTRRAPSARCTGP